MFENKRPGVRKLIDETSQKMFGRKTSESLAQEICVGCGKSIVEEGFKDALSLKEYHISGFCQDCQDSIFGGSDD